jgi:phosphoserine aminotransferase
VLEWVKGLGGVAAMQTLNEKKAALLSDYLANSKLFTSPVQKECRSRMNVTFRAADDEVNARFVKETAANGMENLKGHRSVGGMRASIYNAMPIEGVEKLIAFMKKFEE